MRNLKFLLVAFAIAMSSALYANPNDKFVNELAVSQEIEKLLLESKIPCGHDLEITVFFSISNDRKIQGLAVASASSEVNELLEKKLKSQELIGEFWQEGKIYEVSVGRKALS